MRGCTASWGLGGCFENHDETVDSADRGCLCGIRMQLTQDCQTRGCSARSTRGGSHAHCACTNTGQRIGNRASIRQHDARNSTEASGPGASAQDTRTGRGVQRWRARWRFRLRRPRRARLSASQWAMCQLGGLMVHGASFCQLASTGRFARWIGPSECRAAWRVNSVRNAG